MPQSIRETHLEDICARCKKPHGNHIIIETCGSRRYETIICQHCSYEIIRVMPNMADSDILQMDSFNRHNENKLK
jgi:hypothetical protein